MTNRKISLALLAVMSTAWLTPAQADTISFKIKNQTGQSISSITAASSDGGDPLNLDLSALASATNGPVSLTAPADSCVFTLTTTLSSGQVITNPDTDLCQTDTLVVQ